MRGNVTYNITKIPFKNFKWKQIIFSCDRLLEMSGGGSPVVAGYRSPIVGDNGSLVTCSGELVVNDSMGMDGEW